MLKFLAHFLAFVNHPRHDATVSSLAKLRPDDEVWNGATRRAPPRSHPASSTTAPNNQPTAPASSNPLAANVRPIPPMPSQLFQQLAQSQLELLGSSLLSSSRPGSGAVSKVKSAALYLPQENAQTGQLEFSPAVLYPPPGAERVFIASDADSGRPPALPPTLTKLPGFARASSLLPGYPMVSGGGFDEIGIGAVEEVLCDVRSGGGAALSVPLFSGSQTVGVLLVSPSDSAPPEKADGSVWTDHDRRQVARAAKSLSLALSMDAERLALERQTRVAQEALLDSLHQLKNPLQALRTYGKLLQQRLASDDAEIASSSANGRTPLVLELADHILLQSDRLSDRLKPVDAILDSLRDTQRPLFFLEPAKEVSLVRWQAPTTATAASPGQLLSPINVTSDATPVLWDATVSTTAAAPKDGPPRAIDRSVVPGRTPSTPTILCAEDKMEMTFLEDVLEPILSAFAAIAEDRQIDFSVEVDDDLPGVTVCPLGLQEAVSNLLDNAVKYAAARATMSGARPRSGKPMVRVRLRSNPPSLPPGGTILIEDSGPGIDEAEREAVFARGYRGRQAIDSGSEGTGLGLDIAQTLVQSMGGKLRLLTRREAAKLDCLSGTVMEVTLYRHHTTSEA